MAYDAQDTTLEGAGFDYQGRRKNARDRRRSLKKRDKKKPLQDNTPADVRTLWKTRFDFGFLGYDDTRCPRGAGD